MSIVKRLANLKDLEFIYSCILYGARKGRYSFNAENPEIVKSMKYEIQSVVGRQLLLDQRYARAFVFIQNNKRIATLIMSAASDNIRGSEIYALSVARKYQNQGYGSRIVDDLLNEYQSSDIYARCSPSSEKMRTLLEKRGFRVHSMDDDYRILLRDAVDNIGPLYLSGINHAEKSVEKEYV
ncbi:MAG: GNAT family N-acetyltransferase [Gammaproteobacteria bacterium]|nr:GNAT family N-acetyltransferase [Gammaproteobacteria bacterium]